MTAIQIIRDVGFPIFVVLWFMWRLEKKLDALSSAINRLVTVNTVIARTLDVPEAVARELPPDPEA